jgi:hypothetical protein
MRMFVIHSHSFNLPGGLVVFGLPSISGANQKKKLTLRLERLVGP